MSSNHSGTLMIARMMVASGASGVKSLTPTTLMPATIVKYPNALAGFTASAGAEPAERTSIRPPERWVR